MTSEREAYVYIQLPGTLETVPAALLRMQTLPEGTQIGRFRYGERYLQRPEAVALDPFQLPLAKEVFAFTQLKGIPGAVRDAGPDAWGRASGYVSRCADIHLRQTTNRFFAGTSNPEAEVARQRKCGTTSPTSSQSGYRSAMREFCLATAHYGLRVRAAFSYRPRWPRRHSTSA